ncbi:uncharacterized protein CHSO_1123 [Chryseobacterium sp. StRB126]|uniref:hypothetical protein n=1 Tax=Chryseobacterium sp. StRB126 TaxID=878220 RepID=UPI0004E98CF7|nr:hypothetical protein [Chryseobacterium sp. StRB126]BAP30160.1 uncharacterized protein CHSO_1123 [Chryseobacterium sp. StRB126]
MGAKKTKSEKMAEAVGDAYDERTNKLDVLTFALWIMAKGTRYKADAEDIIKKINPKFFQD